MVNYGHAHRKEREALLAERPVCVWCRAAMATELDHTPPLAAFPPGEWVGQSVPSCKPCNAARGARFATQRRKPTPRNSRRW